MNPITALKGLGYEITLQGQKVAYEYKGKGEPDLTLALPLLEDLKAKKQEALAYLSVQAKGGQKEADLFQSKKDQRNDAQVASKEQKVYTALEAFDPDGALVSLLECARRKGISDDQVASIVDDLIRDKSLKAPWGIKIKNSPIMGDYRIVSDDEAKKLIPGNETAFTREDTQLLAELREIFGAKVVEVKKNE